MDSFVVSARKYRPATFDSVVGQKHITGTLKNAIKNGQLAQAFLFCGPRGVGKTTCARILAKTINCLNLTENVEACGVCANCVAFQNGQSFNVHELDAASNNSVDNIRSLIDQVRIPPQSGKYKVYIVDEVHMLSTSAFNAFLKTLEEPPPYAIFILATTEKHKILPTILSRCQIFDFNRIQTGDIAAHLADIAGKENIGYDEDGLFYIAQKADGGLRDALSMFDQIASFSGNNITYESVIANLNILDYDYYFRITGEALAGNVANTLLIFNEVIANGFDGNNFINGLASHFRNLLVGKDTVTYELLDVSEAIKKRYVEQSAETPLGFLLTGLNLANQCDLQYKQARNPRMQVEMVLIKLCHLPSILDFTNGDAAGASTTGIKKKTTDVTGERNAQKEAQTSPGATGAGIIDSKAENKPQTETAFGEAGKKGTVYPEVKGQAVIAEATIEHNATNKAENRLHQKAKSDIEVMPSQPAHAVNTAQQQIPGVANLSFLKMEGDDGSELRLKVGDEREPFNYEQLLDIWAELGEKFKAEGKRTLYSVLSQNRPILMDAETIEVIVENKVMQHTLTQERVALLNALRTGLRNNYIQLQEKLTEPKKEKMLYTDAEKFNYLLANYPALESMREKMGLEVI